MEYAFRRLTTDDIGSLRELNLMFASAFDDPDSYLGKPPGDEYISGLLFKEDFIALAALRDQKIVGGLVAYVLRKFEQERSEIYIYDLAVSLEHRRHGVASGLIDELKRIAREIDAYVIYVQADKPDEEAIAFYISQGGKSEDVYHFDIDI